MEPGILSSALIANEQAADLFEVFCHPSTGDELVTQSGEGVLKVNGRAARAEIVDRLGNGDVIVRITLETAAMPMLHVVAA